MALAIVLLQLAVVAALRGTWSPCGRSVLSTITPIAERARGVDFRTSASAFVVGGAIGGALLGGVTAAFAAIADMVAGSTPRVLLAGAAVAVCVAADANLGGLRLPDNPRQVDPRWVERFRPWAYGAGFGIQIGAGVTTYVMTNAVYALIVASALLTGPTTALVLCTVFGLTRGLTVWLGAWATTPTKLRSLHALLERTDDMSMAAAMAVQLGVLAVCATRLTAGPPSWALDVVACALALGCYARLRSRRPVLAR